MSLGLTAAGQFLGTPDYTAPEQIEGLPVDGRTDQYALACAVFELLTGQAPFHRSESFAAIWAHLHKPPPSLTERRPELPPAVNAVMAKALAKAQVDRYPTCWEFADALRDALGLEPYHLGSTSDPGLSRTGPRSAALSPSSAASPPAAPARSQGRGPMGPLRLPEQDTGSQRGLRRPAAGPGLAPPRARREGRGGGTPDDQATDPGPRRARRTAPASPDDSAGGPGPKKPPAPRGSHKTPRARRRAPHPPGRPPPATSRGGQVSGLAAREPRPALPVAGGGKDGAGPPF